MLLIFTVSGCGCALLTLCLHSGWHECTLTLTQGLSVRNKVSLLWTTSRHMGVDLTPHTQVTASLEHESEVIMNINIHVFKKSTHQMPFDLYYLPLGRKWIISSAYFFHFHYKLTFYVTYLYQTKTPPRDADAWSNEHITACKWMEFLRFWSAWSLA